MFPWRQFANYPFLQYVVAAVAPLCIYLRAEGWLLWLYSKLSEDFPAPLYTIMGFILSATAIIIATNDSGRLAELSDETPRLWRKLINLFIGTAVLSGGLATGLIFLDSSTMHAFPLWAQHAVAGIAFYIFLVTLLQFGTTLYILARFATAPRGNRAPPPERHRYKVPDYLERREQGH